MKIVHESRREEELIILSYVTTRAHSVGGWVGGREGAETMARERAFCPPPPVLALHTSLP